MAVLEVLTYPNPVLKQVSQPVVQVDEELQALIKDLVETMYASPGCVGIAAPQVGTLKRIIVIDASRNPKCTNHHGHLVLLNPIIEWQEGEVVGREGCLSLPALTANVKRAKNIGVSAQAPDLSSIKFETGDFEARLILHETDHLDGLLFLDRVTCLKTDVFRRKRF